MRRREVISLGWNQRKSHPKQREYATNYHRIFVHAEIHAIIKARQSVEDCHMYVFRRLRDGRLTTSTPCNGCMNAMADAGIKSVTYFENDSFVNLDIESIRDAINSKELNYANRV